MELYKILELETNASELEIRKAYLKLSKKHHPDKNNNSEESNEKFKCIKTAYDILSNTETRTEYLRMNKQEQFTFVDFMYKIMEESLIFSELKKYGINIEKSDLDYLQNNFMNYIKTVNFEDIIKLFKGKINKNMQTNTIDCSESELDNYDENCAEYYHYLPVSYQKYNELDIKLDFNIQLIDIDTKSKKKIKIKRKIEDDYATHRMEVTNFKFNITHPYIVFVGGGDNNGLEAGNLIIHLKLPENIFWNSDFILVEQSMTLYEMIYGIDIHIELSDEMIKIDSWVASRDGFLIPINTKILNHTIAIKLYLDYENTPEKKELLEKYFS